jgi:hypothetical protein
MPLALAHESTRDVDSLAYEITLNIEICRRMKRLRCEEPNSNTSSIVDYRKLGAIKREE